ncbi:hypothetical protein Ancab_017441 [Ancistrocladus abbreviatus]
MTSIEERRSVTRVLDKNTWPRRNMARRQRKTFADVVQQEYAIREVAGKVLKPDGPHLGLTETYRKTRTMLETGGTS